MFTRHLCTAARFAAAALILSQVGTAQAQVVPERYATSRAGTPREAIRSLGVTDPAHQMDVTVWLKLRDQGYLHNLLEQQYDPKSPRYRKWMSAAELERVKPTGEQLAMVRRELQGYGLATVVDPEGFFVRARGTAAAMQSAFHTSLYAFEKDGESFNANVTPAALGGTAGNLVSEAIGLDEGVVARPYIVERKNPATGQPRRTSLNPSSLLPLSAYITNQCFQAPGSVQAGAPGQLPHATYTGNIYQPASSGLSNIQCGYTPAQLQDHYGLTAAYARGLRGEGQTIVIVDAYGSPTILEDANTFAQLSELPALTSVNFQIVYPDGKPRVSNEGWGIETSLDVEWAHALAPNAKIVLVVANGAADQELQFALQYAITHYPGGVISNSWGQPEYSAGPILGRSYDRLLALAAAQGVSVHFATGDAGDFGVGSPVGAAGFPASSPYVTAVGGTSLNVPVDSGGSQDTGWGTNFASIFAGAIAVADPPSAQFMGGSGGGESLLYPKPSWQSALPGSGRQMPDISAVADPYTGVAIVVTPALVIGRSEPQQVAVIGGTSVACPVFTAIWALADQQAGHFLGQAAPAIARMPASAVRDIVPLGSANNVTGVIVDSGGTHSYSAAQLSGPLFNTTTFVSVVFPGVVFVNPIGGQESTGEGQLLTFGTDSSLTTAPGWDNVTGFGEPNGWEFIAAAAAR
jgi:subtilase family serine protease